MTYKENLPSFIDYFTTLSDEEKEYKQLYLEKRDSLPFLHLPLTIESAARAKEKVTLTTSPYLKEGKSNVHICKHPCYMPPYLHSHEFIEITYVARGSAEENIEGKNCTLNKGDLLILNTGFYHTISVFDEHSIIINMIIKKETFSDILYKINGTLFEESYHIYREVSSVELLIEALFEEEIKDASYKKEMQNALLSTLLISLNRRGYTESGKKRRKDKKNIYSILDFISSNLKDVTLTSLSSYLNLTPQYTSTIIKAETDMSFCEILKNKKMEEALELLRSTEQSAKEIAFSLGFTPEHFSRLFKDYFKSSPEKMRKTLQSK